MKFNIIAFGIIVGLLVWRLMPEGTNPTTSSSASLEAVDSEPWPTKTVRVIVPYAAGGGTDTFARKVNAVMKDILPVPLVIENQGGGGGSIGTRNVIDSDPDGYRLLCHHEAMLTSQLSGTVDFGSTELEPIAQTGKVVLLVIVREDSRFNDLKSLMAEAKNRPGKLKFGADVGSLAHFSALAFEAETPGAKMNYITCGGGQVRFTQLAGGHLDAAIFSLSEYLQYRSKNDLPADQNIKAIATLDAVRHERIPDVQTCLEQGFNVSSNNAFYWWAPKGTPKKVKTVMAAALKKAFEHPKLKEGLEELSIEPTFLDGEELDGYVRARIKGLTKVAKYAGMIDENAEKVTEVESSEPWPTKTVRVIVPYAAGGGTDTFARKVNAVMKDILPVPLVIENQGGGGGSIGTRNVIDSDPDGYRLLCHHEAMLTSQLSGTVDFGSTELEPIAQTGKVVLLVIVREDSRFNDLKSLMAEAKNRPGKLKFGADVGSLAHFSALAFEAETPGAKMNYITCGGGQVRFTQLAGGHLDAAIFSLSEYLQYRSKNDLPADQNIKAIATLDAVRHERIPDVQTCLEQGFNVSSNNAFYWWAPKGTPKKVKTVMAAALKKAFEHPKLKEGLEELSIEPTFLDGAEVNKYVKERISGLTKIAEYAGMSPVEVGGNELKKAGNYSSTIPKFNFHYWILGVVALTGLLSLVLKQPEEDSPEYDSANDRITVKMLIALGFFILAILGLQFKLPYSIVIALAIFFIGWAISGWDKTKVLRLAQIAVIFALGTELVFTQIFTVPLPI